MERTLHNHEDCDLRQYDRVWQRVAPGMEPYPQGQMPPPATNLPAMPIVPITPINPELNLPGAQANPCCMGTEAAEMLDVLTGFIEEALSDRRYYLAFARCAPAWAKQKLKDIALAKGSHARRLMAVYYLITGQCYRASLSCDKVYIGQWCAALRERYHAEACGGFNYLRAADGTTDPCLSKLLTQLSEEEYRHASDLMILLERSLN
ncbi:MAG: ferritin-like domain-containing protein [Oscillibacter sp.]